MEEITKYYLFLLQILFDCSLPLFLFYKHVDGDIPRRAWEIAKQGWLYKILRFRYPDAFWCILLNKILLTPKNKKNAYKNPVTPQVKENYRYLPKRTGHRTLQTLFPPLRRISNLFSHNMYLEIGRNNPINLNQRKNIKGKYT